MFVMFDCRATRGPGSVAGERLSASALYASGVLLLCVFLLALVLPRLAAAAPDAPSRTPQSRAAKTYILGVGDTIAIEVHGEKDLSVKVRLSGDGEIDYPFLGHIQAAGKTVRALQKSITQGLADGYLVNPQVRVTVIAFRPIYVRGAVNRPGSYAFSIGMTVGNAIASAGGLNIRASKGKINIIPDGAPPGDKHKATMGTRIAPGETVLVGEGLF